MAKRLLVLHGPNLNLLGEREGRAGGRLADLDAALKARATELGLELVVVQSNHEGVLLDTLHAERSRLQGVVVSPAGLFGSYPLYEALEAIGVPAIEVYVGELGERVSMVSDACAATLEGDGFDAYLEALERFASGDLTGEQTPDEDDEDEDVDEEEDEDVDEDVDEDELAEEPVGTARTLGRRESTEGPRKTLGRKPVVAAPAAPSGPVKTLGRKSTKSEPAVSENVLTRALVRRKVGERLAGRMTPVELAAWARAWWTRLQDGDAPLDKAEKGHADMLDETLRRLTLSNVPATRMSERELVELMTRLDG